MRRRPPVRATRHPPGSSHATAVPARHRQHALGRRGVGRVALGPARPGRPQPGPHGPPRQRLVGGRQGAGVGGVEGGGQLVEQRGVGPGEVRLAGDHRHHVALGDGVEQRQELVADPVAAERRIVVGRVGHRLEPDGRAELPGLPPAQPAQRAAAGRHAREPVEAGAAEQVEQHRLGLVVGRVPGEHVGRQGAVAGRPGPGLDVGPGRHRDALGPERGAVLGRGAPHDLGLGRRPGPQPVVDVDRGDPAAGPHRQHEQRQRVGPAGHGAGHLRAGRGEVAPGEQLGHQGIHRP